jgi:hypothetical protein
LNLNMINQNKLLFEELRAKSCFVCYYCWCQTL